MGAGSMAGIPTSDRMMTQADRCPVLPPSTTREVDSAESERPASAPACFARVSSITTRPGRLAEAASLFKDAVLPMLQAQPGFAGAWLLTDEAAQRGMTLTLWNSEAQRQASEADTRLSQPMQLLAALLVAPPQRHDYVATPLQ